MAQNFADFIRSHPFTFFVGHEGKPIVVHAAAIAATSQQLDALINNGIKESETRRAKLEDVQVDDFVRFCEYAYRGDYTVPPWEDLLPEPSPPPGNKQQNDEDDEWGFSTLAQKKKGKKGRIAPPEPAPEPDFASAAYEETMPQIDYEAPYEVTPVSRSLSRTTLRTQLNNRKYLEDGGPKALILKQFEPRSNSVAEQKFTPVLLAHARLYCFAHVRLIVPLKALTLDKLHKTLMGFKLYTKRIGDIIELTKYAYSNLDLPDKSDNGEMDDLKKLVVEYIVCNIDSIGKCDEFVKYMEEGGEFVGDFWRLARDYMT